MSIKTRLLRWLAGWMVRRYRFIIMDIICGPDRHIHKNPPKKRFLAPVGTSHAARMAGGASDPHS